MRFVRVMRDEEDREREIEKKGRIGWSTPVYEVGSMCQ